jgi:hypothetical protein
MHQRDLGQPSRTWDGLDERPHGQRIEIIVNDIHVEAMSAKELTGDIV